MLKKTGVTIRYTAAFLGGALLLSFFSAFQKWLLRVPAISLDPKAYIVPVFFGGFSGLILAVSYSRLKDSRTHLEDYLNHIDNLVQILSVDKRFLYVNEAWLKTLQYSAEEVKNLTLDDILPSETKQECDKVFGRSLQGEIIPEFETVFLAKDGSRIHVRGTSNGTPVDKSPQRIRGIFKNITAEREAEEFQRLSALIFANTQDGLLITNPRRTILSTNKAFLELSGYQEEELLEKDAKKIFLLESESEAIFSEIVQALKEEKHWQGELWSRKKNGTPCPVEAGISAVVSRYGEVSHYICLVTDISQRKKDELQLREMAWYDPLTKLVNRSHFDQLLEDLIEKSEKKEVGFALFFLDLDGFKKVNDEHGHAMGDQLLQAVARRLQGSLREIDTVARLGGDEFGILLQKAKNQKEVYAIAKKVSQKLNAPYHFENKQIRISASIGISIYPDHKTFDELLNKADTAMYEAKKDKDNTIKFAAAN